MSTITEDQSSIATVSKIIAATSDMGMSSGTTTTFDRVDSIYHKAIADKEPATMNGAPLMAQPPRAAPSPAPQSPTIPNGKSSTPFTLPERPMTASTTQSLGSGNTSKLGSQPSAADMKNIVRRKLTGYVGFANLPNQWHRRSVRKGFSFNVMVVGKRIHQIEFKRNTDAI
jgi:hypothetical protein